MEHEDLRDENSLLPAQFNQRPLHLTGEKRLALAVLELAHIDYNDKKHRPEVIAWVNHDNGCPMPFGECCEILGYNPALFRARFLQTCETSGRLPISRLAGTKHITGLTRRRYSPDIIKIR